MQRSMHVLARRLAPAALATAVPRRALPAIAGFATGARSLHTTRAAWNAVPPARAVESSLSDTEYHQRAEHTLEAVLEGLETLGDEIELAGYDVTYSSGVLTLKLGVHGTYVLNKQPPNKQIWLSSPLSGPRRFDWVASRAVWADTRQLADPATADVLEDVLVAEVKTLLDVDLTEYIPDEAR
ncbi:Mitochondrial matrix iron chaperone [Blastocladiella emersonii ATCC 22665]|nr:Mitochondrial matrix iron chaperone [Blastocladiella emersonii ATCC 22665]